MKILLFLFIPILLFAQFNPEDTKTTSLWRADIGKTLEVDSVTTWSDQIGPYSATQATDLMKPLNGTHFLTFDGNDHLSVASPSAEQDPGTGDFTWSVAAKVTDLTRDDWCGEYVNSSNFMQFWQLNGQLYIQYYIAAANAVLASTDNVVVTANQYVAFVVTCDRDGNAQFYVSDSSGAVTTTTTTMTATNIDLNTSFQIGSRRTTANYMTGDLYYLQMDTTLRSATWANNMLDFLTNFESSEAYYVDATNGDDVKHGESPDSAFQTLNAASVWVNFKDSLLLQKGETWTDESITVGADSIYIGTYGSGNRPIITKSP